MTRKGGATISSGNDAVIEPINNNDLLGLGFESEELEMIEHMSQNEIINKYIETADQEYNINLPDINAVIQATELSDIIPGTQITKRNIAAQTMHNILNQNAGRRSRRRRSRKSRRRKSRRTYKRRR